MMVYFFFFKYLKLCLQGEKGQKGICGSPGLDVSIANLISSEIT